MENLSPLNDQSNARATNAHVVDSELDDILSGPGVDLKPEPEAAPEPPEDLSLPAGVDIDQMLVVELRGVKWVLGLGDDSRVYNWNTESAAWRLFKEVPDPTDL